MGRHRGKGPKTNGPHNGTTTNSSNSSNGGSSNNRIKTVGSTKIGKKSVFSYRWKQIVCLAVLSIVVIFVYIGYLETRVNTPFDHNKMVVRSGLDVPDIYWGSYRPGVYFGMKTREGDSPVMGLMWYFTHKLQQNGDGIRHWCEQNDNLEKFGWLQHDGTNFGLQQIHDGIYTLNTSFIKENKGPKGGEWTARITVDFKNRSKTYPDQFRDVSLIWYTALDQDSTGKLAPVHLPNEITGIRGSTQALGNFTVSLYGKAAGPIQNSYLSTSAPGLHRLKDTLFYALRLRVSKTEDSSKNTGHDVVLAGELLSGYKGERLEPNFVAVQMTATLPVTLDVIYQSTLSNEFDVKPIKSSRGYSEALQWHQTRFQQRFEDTFHLKAKGFSSVDIEFAQNALSNMIGGVGYFFGSSKVQSRHTKEPVPYWNTALYTAVPSRTFFPRGFLWDEGFHGLLIATWDLDMELDIICHWFDTMNVEGWIPREQILGAEATAKVPEEFIVQRNTNANPPTFFLTLQYILDHFQNDDESVRNRSGGRIAALERLYPRLQAWFNWFNTTQLGELAGTYRWRGRDPNTKRELNPKTLTSGLDDYPRASHPTLREYHVDLYCWMAVAADVLAKLGFLLDKAIGYKYEATAQYLRNNVRLNQLHWSDQTGQYADFGLHTDDVHLERPIPHPRSPSDQPMELVRITDSKPEFRLVDTSFGYVSLFPFLLGILEPNSPQLLKILNDLRDPNLLWTPYGLRSLAKNAPLYMKSNTEHDPPYWRGQIWINMNFLAIRALYKYAQMEGPSRDLTATIYKELRQNVIRNLVKEWKRTGYLWEQYNDKTGFGAGCKPFTGWTALVVLIMGEKY